MEHRFVSPLVNKGLNGPIKPPEEVNSVASDYVGYAGSPMFRVIVAKGMGSRAAPKQSAPTYVHPASVKASSVFGQV